MSNAAHLLPKDVAAAATAIANARGARRGAPAVGNILDALPSALFDEVVADARVALCAAAAVLPSPRPRGPLKASDAEALRLELNAGTVLILVRDRLSRASAALSAVADGARSYGHHDAQVLWSLFARAHGESITSPDQQEPTS